MFQGLYAVTDGSQTDRRSSLRARDRPRGVQEDAVTRSAQAPAATSRIHIVPTADSVPGGPAVGAVVKDAGRSLRPVQEARLDALVDRGIVQHPFRSVAQAGVAAGIAPEVAPAGKRQRGPLLDGIEQHPMVDGTAAIALVEAIGVRRVDSHHGFDTAIGGMGVGTYGLYGRVRAGTIIRFVGDVQIQP